MRHAASLWLFLTVVTSIIRNVPSEKFSEFPEAVVEISEEVAYAKLLTMETRVKGTVEEIIKKMLPTLLSSSSDIDISPTCVASLLKTIMAMKDLKLWAVKLLDAIGKPNSGILNGNPSALGSYHECLDVIIPPSRYGKANAPIDTGKYCVVRIRPPLPPRPNFILMDQNVFPRINATFKTELISEVKRNLYGLYDIPFRIGLCLPSSCSNEDVLQILKPISIDLGVNADIQTCEVKEQFKIDKLQMAIITIFIVIAIINIFGTAVYEYDEFINGRNKPLKNGFKNIARCFSIRRNFEKLFETKSSVKRSLDCLNGIRYISTTWIILCHAYLNHDHAFLSEMTNIEPVVKEFAFQAIANAIVSVDSFVFITSVLISYVLVKKYDSEKRFKPIAIFIRRVLRFWPCLALTTGIMVILPLFGSGPFFKEAMGDHANNCRERWWTNFLFIGNFIPFNKMCLSHTWYLAVDLQLIILALIYFLILFRNTHLAKAFLFTILIFSLVSNGVVTYLLEYPPTILAQHIDIRFIVRYTGTIYYLPHVHTGVYAIGLFLGTFLARNPKIKLSGWTTAVGWPVFTASGLAIVYGAYFWNNGYPFSTTEAIIYSAVQRTVWGACLAWVVLACYCGRGGFVNSILSWPGFQPLVRISFLLYLFHLPLLIFTGENRSEKIEATHQYMVYNFFGAFCISHIAAVFLRIFFDSPIIQLEAMFFNHLQKKDHIEEPMVPEAKIKSNQDSSVFELELELNKSQQVLTEGIIKNENNLLK